MRQGTDAKTDHSTTLPTPPRGLKSCRGDPFHPLSLDGCRHLPQADLSGWQHRRLGGVCCHCLDGRPHGIQMTPTGGGPKYQQNSPKAGHSRVLCLFLCLPEIVRDLKSSRAFPFVGWTRPHQRHSLCCGICCGISDTIWEILPMLCHAVPLRAKSTSTLSVFVDRRIGDCLIKS